MNLARHRWFFCWVLVVGWALAGCRTAKPEPGVVFDGKYTAWNTLLARSVNPAGGVDYDGLKKHPELLEETMRQFRVVARKDFDGWNSNQRLAFLANAHNAGAIARIVHHYPIPSLEKTHWLGSARNARDIPLLGERWSLRDLADEAMSDNYLDLRAIFLLNWAEVGCAPLPPVAVTDRNLGDLMERQTRRFMDDPVHCQYDIRSKVIDLSPLLKEYEPQLRRDYTTIWVFLQRYLPAAQAGALKVTPPRVRWLNFDASLNDANLMPVPVIEGGIAVSPAR